MSCPMETELTAYLDGELDPKAREAVERHVGACRDCGRLHAALKRGIERLALLPAFEPSPELRRSFLGRLDAVGEPWQARLRRALRPPLVVPAFGGAVAFAALVVLVLHHVGRPPAGAALDASQLELAENMDLMESYEVLGLSSPEDVEVVAHLQELEKTP